MRDKVFMNVPNKNCGVQPLKKDMICFNRPYRFNLFKGYIPQILLALFLNAVFIYKEIPQTKK